MNKYLGYQLIEAEWNICVNKLTIIGSDNGLSPGQRQAIIWTNDGILLIRTCRTTFNEILSHSHSRKYIGKCRLRNGVYFIPLIIYGGMFTNDTSPGQTAAHNWRGRGGHIPDHANKRGSLANPAWELSYKDAHASIPFAIALTYKICCKLATCAVLALATQYDNIFIWDDTQIQIYHTSKHTE